MANLSAATEDGRVRFFYWADRPSTKLRPLLDSAQLQGIDAQPIGAGPVLPRFHFSLFKQQALYQAVCNLPERTLVCATDGFDVFYQRGADYVYDTFTGFKADVVFSAERGYSHQYRSTRKYFDNLAGCSPYRYLNAGGVIGYAGALRAMYRPTWRLRSKIAVFRRPLPGYLASRLYRIANRLVPRPLEPQTEYLPVYKYTDQAEMAQQFASGRHGLRYALDRDCRLFWCTAFEWDDLDEHYDVHQRRLRNVHTGHTPAMIHVPWGRHRERFERLYETYRQAATG